MQETSASISAKVFRGTRQVISIFCCIFGWQQPGALCGIQKKYNNFRHNQLSAFTSIILQPMKQTAFLQSSLKLSQIQSRLTKNPYLSMQSLPSHADAQVFLLIEKARKTPDRQKHPQLYHWYIIMKQFSKRTLEMWIQASDTEDEEDQLITDFLFEMKDTIEPHLRQPTQNPHKLLGFSKRSSLDHENIQKVLKTPTNTQKRKMNQNYVEFNENVHSSLKEIPNWREKQNTACLNERTPLNAILQKNEICSPTFQVQFIMEMQLNIEREFSPEVIRERLSKEKIQIISFEVEKEIHLRVLYKIDKAECEGLKDRISNWSEVSDIRFRKEKKMGRVEIKSENIISPLRKGYHS